MKGGCEFTVESHCPFLLWCLEALDQEEEAVLIKMWDLALVMDSCAEFGYSLVQFSSIVLNEQAVH